MEWAPSRRGTFGRPRHRTGPVRAGPDAANRNGGADRADVLGTRGALPNREVADGLVAAAASTVSTTAAAVAAATAVVTAGVVGAAVVAASGPAAATSDAGCGPPIPAEDQNGADHHDRDDHDRYDC